ncbi:DUF368 domain-containing protein [Alkalibacterium kapii]|uniref:DUF368 domain-containing protein n=1 Tax=Alkalibacterium kapii TaxID=426704 RepID=A0A511AVG5_9LACT|nr:DUF368 domain-containing protein [Alkalibacterium kapii]GEK92199.1 DUF368 domain-containing protein [Alkalibacterium kapii]
MQYMWLVIKGLFIGVSNIIPGVSGGTMAVSFGIYDDIIHAFTHVRKEFKLSMRVLIPIVTGAILGVAGFSMIITWLLDEYTLYTSFAFVGLILGGLPILSESFKESLNEKRRKMSVVHVILFVVFFAIVAWMGVADVSGGGPETISLGAGPLIALFFVGLVSAAAMVVPGISGSLLMLIMGYYYAVVYAINGFTSSLTAFNLTELIPFTVLLTSYAFGMLAGIILISKVIDYFFMHYPSFTYAAILGLVTASPVAVIANTDALDGLATGNAVMKIAIALIVALTCFMLTFAIGKTEDATEELPEETRA